MYKHHDIFKKFKCFKGEVDVGFTHDFLGVMTRIKYFSLLYKDEYNKKRYVETSYPVFDEEYFEWIDLLEAVTNAKGIFTMIELGAGWGRWLCRAIAALRQINPKMPYFLIGVEAEPTHFRWMIEHLKDNNIDLQKCTLIEAAANHRDGTVNFYVGNAFESYGQMTAIANAPGTKEVKAISLSTILKDLDFVDLIDLDIQGSEFHVLASAVEELNNKVKLVHIGTHFSLQIEEELRMLFASLGWHKKHDFSLGKELDTNYGKINFEDGVQSWLNPKFIK